MALPPLVGPGPRRERRDRRRRETADHPAALDAGGLTATVSTRRSLRGPRTIPTCGEVELSAAPLEGHAGERTLFSPGLQSVADQTHMSSPRGRELRPRGIEPDTL